MLPSISAHPFADPEYRVEGRNKVTGSAAYAADVVRPGTLWAAFARSPHAHARIVAVDLTEARRVPGVRAVLASADVERRRFGRQICDWPILAIDTVRFVGERVAAVAAETREAAEAAAQAVQVVYAPLPAVLDAEAALRPGAPTLHPEWDDYPFPAYEGKPRPARAHPNIQGAYVKTKGDPDRAFARAAHVFEHRFTTPRQHCGYLEPRATLVWIDGFGIVHVHSPNKHPFPLREQLARATGVPVERIVVECTAIGGDFGGKGLTLDEYPCYFLARATGRPVRSVQRYGDELADGTTRHACSLVLRTACAADGTFLAHDSHVVLDGGAYAAGKPRATLIPGSGYALIPYRIPDARIEVATVYTNTLPAAHVRGPGEVQVSFAWEQHVDMIAAALGFDPLALRLKNLLRDGDTTPTGEPVAHPAAREVLETLRGELARAPAAGARGIALTCSHTGGGKTSLKLTLDADCRVEVVAGIADQGAGALTMLQRVVAEALRVEPAAVSVRQGNTAEAFADPGAGASRVTNILGRAAEDAATKLIAALEQRCGMPFRDGAFQGAGGRASSFAEVARAVAGPEGLEVVGAFDSAPPGAPHAPDLTFGAYAVDVSVDEATGALTVHDALYVADLGTVVNPVAHRGQLAGGFVFGLGGALLEELPIDENGKVTALSLGEYKLPASVDVPPFRAVAVDAAPGHGPSGAKMAGELTNVGVAPAIANAVYHAVGVRLFTVPLTAERIFAALERQRTGAPAREA